MSPASNFKYVGQMCDGLFFDDGGPILMKPARIIVGDNVVRFLYVEHLIIQNRVGII